MPDYSNDKEVIQHIDTTFLKPLDEEATRRISTYCVQTGVGVAISPWASLDMLLSLWRSIKMIDDIAQVYGVRPSLPNRLRLRSEEHTSELQSRPHLVCRLLLEKKNTTQTMTSH